MTYGRYDDYHGRPTVGRITPITDKDAIIPGDLWDPHYMDGRFTHDTSDGLTIFVDPDITLVKNGIVDELVEDLTYDYSDRIYDSLGHAVVQAAREQAASEVGNIQSARFVERMLQHAFKNPDLWLGHMRAGVNRSNGYSYKMYGYRPTGSA
jgi:hypothetical protein